MVVVCRVFALAFFACGYNRDSRMHIGTPLTDHATRVMLLGSGELGKEMAIALQRLGIEVIAVDRYPHAPAMQVAHRAHVIDMTDAARLRELVERERPQLIVPEIEALATDALADMERERLARIVPNARAVQLTMNREGIRRLAAESLALPTSPYAFADSLDELRAAAESVGFPCFVKPVMSSSGKGQSVVASPPELGDAWEKARRAGRVDQGRVIVEGRIDFDFEITLLTVRSQHGDGVPETRCCAPIGHRQVEGDYVESWQPVPMTPTQLERAETIARAVVEGLGGVGLYGVELFVQGEQVWFSEVSPRPHDTGMVTMISQVQSEFELHVRSILGLPVDTGLRQPGASAVIYAGTEGSGLVYEGVDAALSVPGTELRLFGKPEGFRRRRMGVALACGATLDEARARAREAATRVRPRLPT